MSESAVLNAPETKSSRKRVRKPKRAVKVETHANGAAFTSKHPGVIASIVELLRNASSKQPITKDEIFAALVKRFPDRDEKKMKATLNMQLPAGLRAEKGYEVVKNDRGYYLPKQNCVAK